MDEGSRDGVEVKKKKKKTQREEETYSMFITLQVNTMT